MKSQYFKIPVELYGYTVIVSLGQTDDELWSNMKSVKIPKNVFDELAVYADNAFGRAVLFENGCGLIRLKLDNKDVAYFQGLMAHEIFHMVSFIMNDVGMKLSDDSDEAYAYLTGFITQKIYEKIFKHNK